MESLPIGKQSTQGIEQLFNNRVQFQVSDSVKMQVVDIQNDRVVRQLPLDKSSALLQQLYAWKKFAPYMQLSR